MTAIWSHTLFCPRLYLDGKAQSWVPLNFLEDISAAEYAVASMAWDAILAQPTYGKVGFLRFLDHGSARFVFMAQDGSVVAHSAEPILTQ